MYKMVTSSAIDTLQLSLLVYYLKFHIEVQISYIGVYRLC